jgi:hypothetical protein
MSLDLRVAKLVPIGERLRLELIAEGFNLFNRFNEAAASPFIDDVRLSTSAPSNGPLLQPPHGGVRSAAVPVWTEAEFLTANPSQITQI